MTKPLLSIVGVMLIVVSVAGCTPEVGSKAWCEAMEKKSKLDWSARELKDYAKFCLDQ